MHRDQVGTVARNLRALSVNDIERLPSDCRGCTFWETAGQHERRCGSVCDLEGAKSWHRRVNDEWGDCGRVAVEDDAILGFIKYAPSGYFPQAATFTAAPRDPDVPLIACIHIDHDARHRGLGSVLLRAALRDLSLRGERQVEAFGSVQKPAILDESPLISMDFLLRNGFTVSRPDPVYPLLKLDLKTLAMWSENLEAVLDSLRLSRRRMPKRVPAS